MEDVFPIEKSDYLQQHLAERAAVAEHKWYLSERAGHDVGWEYANWNWVMAGHRKTWVSAYQNSGCHRQH